MATAMFCRPPRKFAPNAVAMCCGERKVEDSVMLSSTFALFAHFQAFLGLFCFCGLVKRTFPRSAAEFATSCRTGKAALSGSAKRHLFDLT